MPSNTPIPPDEALRRRDETVKEAHALYERRLKAWESYNPRKSINDPVAGRAYFTRFVSGETLENIAKSEGYKTIGPVGERIRAYLLLHITFREWLDVAGAPGVGVSKWVSHFAKTFREHA